MTPRTLARAVGRLVAPMTREPAPPRTPPPCDGPRPALGRPDDYVSTRRTVVVAVPRRALAAWLVHQPLEDLLHAVGSLPAVARTEPVTPGWGAPGDRRRVVLSDGHQAVEEILRNDGATQFRYQVWGFTNRARHLADHAVGMFEFADAGDGTEVVWTYAFRPRSALTRLPLRAFVARDWSAYMTAALARVRDAAERAERDASG